MHPSTKAISAVIPAHNASPFLAETIESILAQTFEEWELLIIDDGSKDNTAEIAKSYSQKDSRIQLVQQINKGVSAARNVGVQLTQGQFIAFLDADDRWLPEKLATHLEHLKLNPEVGVSFGRVEFISYDGKPTGLIASARLTNLKAEHFLYNNPTITTSNLVVRREIFQQLPGFDPDMSYSEDIDWLFRVLCSTQWKIEAINQVLVEYRITEKGLSSDLYRIEEGWKQLIAKAQKNAPQLVNNHYPLAQATHLRYLARQTLRLGLPPQVGIDFMTRALQSDWRLVFKEPRRTLMTSLAVYGKYLFANFYPKLKF
jgi:glycosyltransferase involved in cell wall biosynthesis